MQIVFKFWLANSLQFLYNFDLPLIDVGDYPGAGMFRGLKGEIGKESSNSGRVRYGHFRAGTLGEVMNTSLLPSAMG